MESGYENMASNAGPEMVLKRNIFFRKIKSKLMTLAMAGLVTLGSGSKAAADQIHFEKKSGSIAEITIEPAITAEKLHDLEVHLQNEEPEFWQWLMKYETDLKQQLDLACEQLLSIDQNQDLEMEGKLKSKTLSNLELEGIFKDDHRVINYFKANPGVLESYQQILKDNLREILLGVILLDQSQAVRKNLVSFGQAPRIVIEPHNRKELSGARAFVTANPVEIHTTPRIFLDKNKHVEYHGYINTIIHELTHALHGGDGGYVDSKQSSLYFVLIEGATQNITYEIIQYLQTRVSGLNNALGSHIYDERILAAAVIDALSKSYGTQDALARWSADLIGDSQLAEELRSAAEHLGLDRGIADDVGGFSSNGEPRDMDQGLRLSVKILVRLQNSGLTLPANFIESILTKDRNITQDQAKKIKDLSEISNYSARNLAKKLRQK